MRRDIPGADPAGREGDDEDGETDADPGKAEADGLDIQGGGTPPQSSQHDCQVESIADLPRLDVAMRQGLSPPRGGESFRQTRRLGGLQDFEIR